MKNNSNKNKNLEQLYCSREKARAH